MYQALYRKYRPLVFSDVTGQAHITDTLRAQVEAGRLSHAYLFTGTRGTGKTTCAKILARASICLAPENGSPCNRCAPCAGALDGSLLDVTEIDAASNSGIDNIRALRDETAYTPVSARRRVYIIDEVHMLSVGASNALLKTLEEPPEYVLFILATTETHKVPATILSRCQRFAFKRLSAGDIAGRLNYVAAREGLTLSDEASGLLARLSDGAMRDALSLLDQCVAASPGGVELNDVFQALGLAGEDEIRRWADSIASGDAERALALFDGHIQNGRDAASLFGELSQIIRDVLSDKIINGVGASADALGALDAGRLLELLTEAQDGLSRLSRAAAPRIEAELCVLRMCLTEGGLAARLEARVARLEDIVSGGAAAKPAAPSGDASKKAAHGPDDARARTQTAARQPDKDGESLSDAPASETVSDGAWESVRRRVAAELPHSLGTFLMLDGVTLCKTEGFWQLVVPDELTYGRLSAKEVTDRLSAAAQETTGHPVTVRVVLKEPGDCRERPQLKNLLNQFTE
ncbi:MAG: DNA polymerase III subunit gamma/tau [Oscillospiraceae bacterium]|nr:DNA polymerase III subunit gamma/tau [Oscillospiraceae bacterium]